MRKIGCAASTITPRRSQTTTVRAADVHDPARLSRPRAAAAPPIRPRAPGCRSRSSPATRDVRLTIDAGFSSASPRFVAGYASKSAGGRAAAVVHRSGHGRAARERELSVAGRWNAGSRHGNDAGQSGALLRSRALRALSARFDVQAGDGRRGAARRTMQPSDNTFTCTRLPDGRVGAKHPRLEPAGPRRRARHASARHDRHARRPGAFLQRVFRAAGGRARAGAVARHRRAARHLGWPRAEDVARGRTCAKRCRRSATGRGTSSRRRCGWLGCRGDRVRRRAA